MSHRNLSDAQFGQVRHAQVHTMGGDPARGYPHAFMPVCDHPDHHTDPQFRKDYQQGPGFWSGSVHRGNDTDSPGWHQAWDEATAHDIRYHGSSDNAGGIDYSQEDPFSPRRVKE